MDTLHIHTGDVTDFGDLTGSSNSELLLCWWFFRCKYVPSWDYGSDMEYITQQTTSVTLQTLES